MKTIRIAMLAPIGSDAESLVHYPAEDEAGDVEQGESSADESEVVAASASPDPEARED